MTTVFTEGHTWKAKALTLRGQTGTHSRLIALALSKGLQVEADDADKELTFIARPGIERFGRRVIGEIRGGDNAVVKLTVRIE